MCAWVVYTFSVRIAYFPFRPSICTGSTRIYVLRFDINHTFLVHNFILLSFLRISGLGHFYLPKKALEMYLDWDRVKECEMISVRYAIRISYELKYAVDVNLFIVQIRMKYTHAHEYTHLRRQIIYTQRECKRWAWVPLFNDVVEEIDSATEKELKN